MSCANGDCRILIGLSVTGLTVISALLFMAQVDIHDFACQECDEREQIIAAVTPINRRTADHHISGEPTDHRYNGVKIFDSHGSQPRRINTFSVNVSAIPDLTSD